MLYVQKHRASVEKRKKKRVKEEEEEAKERMIIVYATYGQKGQQFRPFGRHFLCKIYGGCFASIVILHIYKYI